jgi:hypothetical protein
MFSIVIFGGRRLFGRVDQVGGLFHVATMFVHIFFVPLIPLKSFVVLNATENFEDFRGIGISMSLKSVLAAYLRAFFVLGAMFQIFKLVRLFLDASLIGLFPLILILKCAMYIGLYLLSRKSLRAGRERALAVARKAGLDENVIEQHFAQTSLTGG